MPTVIDPVLLNRALTRTFTPADAEALAHQVACAFTNGGEDDVAVQTLQEAMGGTVVMCEWLGTIPGLPTFVAAAVVIAYQVEVWAEDPTFVSRVRALRERLPHHVSVQLCPGLPLDGMTLRGATNRLLYRLSTRDLSSAAHVVTALADLLVLVGEGLEPGTDRDELVATFKSQREVVVSSLDAAERELAAAS